MVSPRRTTLLLAGTLLGVAGLAAAPAQASTPAVRFAPALLHGLSVMTDHGALPATRQLTVSLDLQRPHAAAEAAFVDAVEKGTARPLTVAQFAERFAVPQTTYDQARAYLTAHGMRLVSSTPARDHLVVSGSTAQTERTFGTALDAFTYAGKSFFANTTAPLVPAGLPVVSILGLETLHAAHLDSAGVHPRQGTCTGGTCVGDVTPQDLWSIYDQPSTVTGNGQKVTIFGEGATQYVIDDLRQFEKENHLRTIPVKVNYSDGTPVSKYTSTDGDGEWQLDTQSSTGMAYDADELDMEWGVDLNDASTMNVLEKWVTDKSGSYAASASYSECEPTVGDLGGAEGSTLPAAVAAQAELAFSTDAYTKAYEQGLTEAVALGKTLFSSSGDTGSSCGALPADLNGATPTEGTPGVGFPGSSPHAVDVGGTVLYGTQSTAKAPASNEKRAREYGWTSSGGGPSEVFPAPAYQASVTGANAPTDAPDVPCVTDLTGAPVTSGVTCRKLPDVSAISGDIVTNGYSIVDDKADSATGGTSLSSPVMLGLWTRVQSAAGGTGLGYANPLFYKHAKDFFDPGATMGADAAKTLPSSNGLPSADGFDEVTGLGVMDVGAFIKDAVPARTTVAPAKPTRPTTPPKSAPVGGTAPSLPTTGLDTLPVTVGLVAMVLGALLRRGGGLRRRRRA